LSRCSSPLAVVLALALGGAGSGACGQGWALLYQDETVRVEQRDYAGSPLHEVRGSTRLQVSLNAIMALLKDADFNDRWVYRSGGAKILAQDGYHRAYVHGIVDAPWPMQDRDTVVRFDYQQDPQTRIIHINIVNFPDYIPPLPGLVRVPEFGGFWELRPEPGGWVSVTYQVHGHPGGFIPVWVANRAAGLSVTRTLLNMADAVERYSDARAPEVQELPPEHRSAPMPRPTPATSPARGPAGTGQKVKQARVY
jgi:hypothetical protein